MQRKGADIQSNVLPVAATWHIVEDVKKSCTADPDLEGDSHWKSMSSPVFSLGALGEPHNTGWVDIQTADMAMHHTELGSMHFSGRPIMMLASHAEATGSQLGSQSSGGSNRI